LFELSAILKATRCR